MVLRIEQDHQRFHQIIRGKIRRDLRKYMSKGELIGRKGKNFISIPLPQIEIPRFQFSPRQVGGVGQGEGDIGTVIGQEPQSGTGEAGNLPGQHILEVEVSLEDLARILGEELELPRIQPRGRRQILTRKDRYTGIASTGPETLRHFKRTFKEALKRQIASGKYSSNQPLIVPIREDKRYRTWRAIPYPESTAVIIYMMDVSGSMGEEQKEIVRIESFWIETWLQSQYKGLQSRHIIHDAEAREVDAKTFYHTRESGGTVISSAYKLTANLIQEEFPPEDWNIYAFHFSDGDNWSQGDTDECVEILKQRILPHVNLFCYGQVESPYGTGQFFNDLKEAYPETENLVASRIENKEGIHASIKEFLGKGK